MYVLLSVHGLCIYLFMPLSTVLVQDVILRKPLGSLCVVVVVVGLLAHFGAHAAQPQIVIAALNICSSSPCVSQECKCIQNALSVLL